MKVEEKIKALIPTFDRLSLDFGDYSVRRAMHKWMRDRSWQKYKTKIAEERHLRSVWLKAVPRKKVKL